MPPALEAPQACSLHLPPGRRLIFPRRTDGRTWTETETVVVDVDVAVVVVLKLSDVFLEGINPTLARPTNTASQRPKREYHLMKCPRPCQLRYNKPDGGRRDGRPSRRRCPHRYHHRPSESGEWGDGRGEEGVNALCLPSFLSTLISTSLIRPNSPQRGILSPWALVSCVTREATRSFPCVIT